jgi:uncharacterized DUF497 family protein
MKILPDPKRFEWDKGNNKKNFEKHNVTIQETEELFSNEPFIISEDIKHSTKYEQRFQALGKTNKKRKLFVSFTIRTDKIRIISVRDMNKKEEVAYETIQTHT